MHDIKWIREHADAFDEAMGKRGLSAQSGAILDLDQRHRQRLTEAQDIQADRNRMAKEIGAAKSRGEDAGALIEQVSRSKEEQAQAEEQARSLAEQLKALLESLPNLPFDDVPVGKDEADNIEVRRVGAPPQFEFDAKPHEELGEALSMMDFDTAAKISGARFVVLTGALARLERALSNFMLDLHTGEHGYKEVNPPALVRDNAMYGTGQLPKFAEDLFQTTDGRWLIPTAEVPLTNILAGQLVAEETLPRRYTAMTWCFRSEAGAAGRDTRGMIRQHQFTKVEMVSMTRPEDSETELERMTACAEEVLKRLGLAYRVVMLSTGDMGFSARRTYDLEVWFPSQNTYREISSCSNCGDFQARRMDGRYRPTEGKGTRFVHSLNGSGVAVGRAMIAVMENYQREDGSIVIPEALRPYMGGMMEIRTDG